MQTLSVENLRNIARAQISPAQQNEHVALLNKQEVLYILDPPETQ